jgi:N-methylhydantoinase A
MAGNFVIGVDIGGTFTDCVVVDGRGAISIGKAPSTPPDFDRGFVNAVREAAERMGVEFDLLLSGAQGIYHGCTVGTNALVESQTAKTGLITTSGHEDAIFMMKAGSRLNGMDPAYVAHIAHHTKPEPLVPRSLVEGIDERVAFDGATVVNLNEGRCREAIERLLAAGIESFAVSLLWSVIEPAHELRVAELIREVAPDAFISLSHQVVARVGEYERTVATVINGLIGPVTSAYLRDLEAELTRLGYGGRLFIMSCSGGVIDASQARALPLLTIGSGPVAGLIGAGRLSEAASTDAADEGAGLDVLTGDMGGTTFDVGVIRRGSPITRRTTRHDQYEYYVPTLDVRSIGAGGGSIVHYDSQVGSLRVGPRSAGARPGPAAYLQGGTEATVTDADLILGYLNPEYFLGGNLQLGTSASREALERAGRPLGLGAEETAAAAARIVDAQMSDAIRLASVQQGYDPRDQVMYAYGGAGAVHCPAVARELGITKLVIPLGDLAAGWSAFGAGSADAYVVQEKPLSLSAPLDPDALNQAWAELQGRVEAALTAQGLDPGAVAWERSVDMRYQLQVNEVIVEAPLGDYDESTAASLIPAFEREYERLFGEGSGYAAAGFALSAARVGARARVSDFELARRDRGGAAPDPEPTGERDVIWYEHGGEPRPTPIYSGERMATGGSVVGPAIVEFADTTLVLREGQVARSDPFGSVVIDA